MRHIKSTVFGLFAVALLAYVVYHEFAFPPIHADLCGGGAIFPRPRGMTAPAYINPPKNREVVIFIHGIRDDGSHTWTTTKMQYWPSLLASSAPEWDVYVAQYPDTISIG